MNADLFAEVQGALDREFFVDVLREIIEIPTEVPLGPNTLIDADHPKLVEYVQDVLRPIMEDAGIYNILEMPLNQVVVKMGSGISGESLLIQAYTPTQHQNLMRDPFIARIACVPELEGDEREGDSPEGGAPHASHEPAIFGQGVSQNKVHQAAMITVLKAFVESEVPLEGTLYFAINNEGRSSHHCSEAIIAHLHPKPRYGILLTGTGMNITVANRGRVDVYVHVRGKAAHSSTPWLGHSAIDGANEVINRIRAMRFSKTHPNLGGQHAVPYQVVYSPVAPHTLPDYARISVDRRLLPGDDVVEAVNEVRAAIGDISPFGVEVEGGVHMLPAEVDPGSPVVQRLRESNVQVRGVEPELLSIPGAFDAGGLCAMGIPTVMWGASGGDGLLGDDWVTLKDGWDEVVTLCDLIANWLG